MCIDSSWAGWKKKLPWLGLALLLLVVTVLLMSGKPGGTGSFGELLEDISRETQGNGNNKPVELSVYPVHGGDHIYLRLLFLPLGQNADPMFPFKTGFFDGLTPLAFLFLLALIVFAIRVRKKMPAVTFGIFWFFITLLVESSVIPIKDAMFEHRLYLPMFGFAIGLSATVFQGLSKRRFSAVILLTCLILVLGALTYHRNKVWQNAEVFWTDVLSKSPHNRRAHTNLGIALSNKGNLTEAIEQFTEIAETACRKA